MGFITPIIAAMSSAASAAAPLLTAGGIGLKALGQVRAGQAADVEAQAAADQAEFNAKVQEQEAKAQRQKAEFEQRRQHRRAKRAEGTLIARLGLGGGLESQAGEAILAEQASESELENLMLGYEGEVLATRAESQAALDRTQAGISRKRGKTLARAGRIGAGATLLTGFGRTSV